MVVDCSVVVDILFDTADATVLGRRVFGPSKRIHVPHLLDIEMAQVVRRFAAHGELTAKRGADILTALGSLPLRRWPHRQLLSRVWDLRHNLTAYDALYVALAEALDDVLLTRDRRLAAAARATGRVEVV